MKLDCTQELYSLLIWGILTHFGRQKTGAFSRSETKSRTRSIYLHVRQSDVCCLHNSFEKKPPFWTFTHRNGSTYNLWLSYLGKHLLKMFWSIILLWQWSHIVADVWFSILCTLRFCHADMFNGVFTLMLFQSVVHISIRYISASCEESKSV